MTEIERKALELTHKGTYLEVNVENMSAIAEAYRNLHERHEAFRQEVSDAITNGMAELVKIGTACERASAAHYHFNRFIITKPDPLVEAWLDAFPGNHMDDAREECAKICAALAKRGLKIVEKSDG